jgi:predicted metal-dependent hydrolase
MFKEPEYLNIGDIELKVVFSSRKTLGISVLPDSSVIVRAPYRTSLKSIIKMVEDKSSWIIRHRDNFRNHPQIKKVRSYTNGSLHPYRGNTIILNIRESTGSFVKFNGATIEMGLEKTNDEASVSRLLKRAYKREALIILPNMFYNILEKYNDHNFKFTELVIRSMKRRWGSCSNNGKITLSSELIKLGDTYIEYVIIHELCHLKQHNHGPKYYEFLSKMYPDWKQVRKEMKMFII